MPNKHAKKSYDGELVPGLDISKKNLSNGVAVKTYLGEWDWVPEFSQMSSEASSLEKNINLKSLPNEKNAGLLLSGFIQIPEPGNWTFHCGAMGKLIFKIHNKLVIDGDYEYDGTEISTTLKLDRGIHPYRLYYTNSEGEPSLNLKWEGPSVAKGSIPANALLVQGVQKR